MTTDGQPHPTSRKPHRDYQFTQHHFCPPDPNVGLGFGQTVSRRSVTKTPDDPVDQVFAAADENNASNMMSRSRRTRMPLFRITNSPPR